MDNLARNDLFQPIHQEYATVAACQTDGAFVVRTFRGQYVARKAVSCLIQPHIGDKVLLAADAESTGYILAVLEHDGDTALQMRFDDDLHIDVRRGRLKIGSQEGIDLASAGDVSTTAETVKINAVKGRFNLHNLSFQSAFLRSQVERVQWIGRFVDALADRVNLRARRIYRTADEFEQVRAGRLDCLVKKLLSFRSHYTIMTAKEDVKVDGERIHIG
jgi:hypothetical protein